MGSNLRTDGDLEALRKFRSMLGLDTGFRYNASDELCKSFQRFLLTNILQSKIMFNVYEKKFKIPEV